MPTSAVYRHRPASMVERRNGRVVPLIHAPRGLKRTIELSKSHSSLHAGKQQVNARKPPVRIWQLSNSAAAGDGMIGFRLIDRAEVVVCQIDGTDREHDPQRERLTPSERRIPE